MSLATLTAAAAVFVTFTWDAVPDVAAYRVDCGLRDGQYNFRRYWTQDYGPPQATSIQVRATVNRPWFCVVRSYGNGTFSDYSNQIRLTPLRVGRDVEPEAEE